MKKYFIITSLIFLIIGCNNKSSNKQELNFANRDYQNELKEMPSYLVSHFPKKIESLPITSLITVDTTSQCIYYMLLEFKKEKALYLQKIFEKKHLAKYQSSDSNLILIKIESIRHKSKEKIIYNKIIINNKTYFPLPFFETYDYSKSVDIVKTEDVYSNSTKCGLSKDFIIYVLDSKPGHYWKGLTPLNYMPNGWKNGYSKGICINKGKGIIIYWGLIW